jgi:enediyne biosynthesis protein E4
VGQTGKSIVMAPRSRRSSVMFDLDNDGDLDIITNDFNSEPQVLISDLAQRSGFIG